MSVSAFPLRNAVCVTGMTGVMLTVMELLVQLWSGGSGFVSLASSCHLITQNIKTG